MREVTFPRPQVGAIKNSSGTTKPCSCKGRGAYGCSSKTQDEGCGNTIETSHASPPEAGTTIIKTSAFDVRNDVPAREGLAEIVAKVQSSPPSVFDGYFAGEDYSFGKCVTIRPPPSRVWYSFTDCPKNGDIFTLNFLKAHWFASWIIHNACYFLHSFLEISLKSRPARWKLHSELKSGFSLEEWFGPYDLNKETQVFKVLADMARGMHSAIHGRLNRRIQFRCNWEVLGGIYENKKPTCLKDCESEAKANPPLKDAWLCNIAKCCTV